MSPGFITAAESGGVLLLLVLLPSAGGAVSAGSGSLKGFTSIAQSAPMTLPAQGTVKIVASNVLNKSRGARLVSARSWVSKPSQSLYISLAKIIQRRLVTGALHAYQ